MTSLPVHICVCGICAGEWDTVVVQISMKNCRTKGSDSALQSPSLAKLISVKILGVKVYQGGGLTSLPGHIASVEVEWGE